MFRNAPLSRRFSQLTKHAATSISGEISFRTTKGEGEEGGGGGGGGGGREEGWEGGGGGGRKKKKKRVGWEGGGEGRRGEWGGGRSQ